MANSKKIELALVVVGIAQEHEGCPFGGFVRDVMVPRLDHPRTEPGFNDLDLWFLNQEQADSFIEELNSRFPIKPLPKNYGGLKVTNFTLGILGVELLEVDVIVNSTFPVNDFLCNAVYCNLEGEVVEKYPGALEDISKKRARLLMEQIPLLHDYCKNPSEEGEKALEIVERAVNRFENRGWGILFPRVQFVKGEWHDLFDSLMSKELTQILTVHSSKR